MPVSRETRMARYLDLLDRWGASLNLVSARDRLRLEAHVSDSLTLLPHLPSGLDRLIDLGSGQGFPAIPVAIESGIAIALIEADRRKAAFLTTVLATLQIPGTVSASRIENTVLEPARCVTARALAPLSWLVGAAKPFLAEDGYCLFLKGPAATGELLTARKSGAVGEIIAEHPPSYLVKMTTLG